MIQKCKERIYDVEKEDKCGKENYSSSLLCVVSLFAGMEVSQKQVADANATLKGIVEIYAQQM